VKSLVAFNDCFARLKATGSQSWNCDWVVNMVWGWRSGPGPGPRPGSEVLAGHKSFRLRHNHNAGQDKPKATEKMRNKNK